MSGTVDSNDVIFVSESSISYEEAKSRSEIFYNLGFVRGVLQTLVLGGKLSDNEKSGCETAINKLEGVLKVI